MTEPTTQKGQDHNSPGLEIFLGCMFAAKSTNVLARLFTVTEVGLNALYINHKIDVRNKDDVFSSHNPQLRNKLSEGKVRMIQTDCLESINKALIEEADVIAIDEAHFFPDLNLAVEWVDKLHKRVIIASLDGNYKRERFGKVLDLIPKADTVTKLSAYCVLCSKNKILRPAIFTHKFVKPNTADTIVDVGAHDKYASLCRACYLTENS